MTPPLYLTTDRPNYCPFCGEYLADNFKDKYTRADFHAHASFSCNCGAHFQKASEAVILMASDIEGDLKVNIEKEQ